MSGGQNIAGRLACEVLRAGNTTMKTLELPQEVADFFADKTCETTSLAMAVGFSLQKFGFGKNTLLAGILICMEEKETNALIKKLAPETKEQALGVYKKTLELKELYQSFKSLKPKAISKWQKPFLNEQAENLRKMFFALTRDLRPVFSLLVWGLEEMKKDKDSPQNLQIKKALACLEILSPLAYGLGMGEIKGQLEDLAFPILYPKEYQWLLNNIKEKYESRKKYLAEIEKSLRALLEKEKIPLFEINTRAKHYFSLYQKLLRYQMDLEQIYDLVALRIILPDNNIEDCYKVLGILHKTWQPLPGRIKDYISSPKLNGYRSLHTTVLCKDNKVTEFQIKTLQMHQEAEHGAAAHLAYKEQGGFTQVKSGSYWLDQIRKWKTEAKDSKTITQYLSNNLFPNRIFIFTPKGDVINLPNGSTPIDFAYAVHTFVGEHCEGAKINGKIAVINQPLKTGQTIEILINKNQTPSEKWLRFVKTRKARMKIRQFLEKAYGIAPKKKKVLRQITERVASFTAKIFAPKKPQTPQVIIAEQTNIAFRLSKCCSPRPNDPISAFITQGQGASVHKTNCPNLKTLAKKWPQRIVSAQWE